MSTLIRSIVTSLVLFSSQFAIAYVECISHEKNVNQSPRFILKYFKPGQRAGGRNQFANVLVTDNRTQALKNSQPTTFTLCLARPNVNGTMVSCESAMGSTAYLLVQLTQKTGAYKDGPFQLTNLSCREI